MAPVMMTTSHQGSGDILLPPNKHANEVKTFEDSVKPNTANIGVKQNFGHSTSRLMQNTTNTNGDSEVQHVTTQMKTQSSTDSEQADNNHESRNPLGRDINKHGVYEKMVADDSNFELQMANRGAMKHENENSNHRASPVVFRAVVDSASDLFSYQNRPRKNTDRMSSECKSLEDYLSTVPSADVLVKGHNSNDVSFADSSFVNSTGTAGGDASYSFRRGAHGLPSERDGVPTRTGPHTGELRELVEQEQLRRKHCEEQIKQMHSRCLDLEQQLAVARDSLRKKDNNIQSLDQTMKQLIDKWRDQENERQEKIKETVSEKERLATAVSSQQSVIETFEKDFTEAIGQIEFLQQKNKRLEEQTVAAQEETKSERDRLQSKIEELEQKQLSWKGEREDLLKQKNRLTSERDKLKKETEENGKKLEQLQNKSLKEASTEKRLLEAEYKKCKDLKKEIGTLQKTLESLNQQLESERSERSSLEAELQSHSSRLSNEVAKAKQSGEKEAEARLQRELSEVNSQWELRFEEERRKHSLELRRMESTFKAAMEALRSELASENEQKMGEMRKLATELETRNKFLQSEVTIVQEKADKNHGHTLELKRCFERNYLEVMNLIEKTMSNESGSGANNFETFKRPSSARDSYSPMVPQKLISSPAIGHSTNGQFSNSVSNQDNVSNSTSLTQRALFYRHVNPNSVRESTANTSINFGPTERLELPSSAVGVNSGHTVGMSTPAAEQFYSAGTTPSEETETAPFASRESFEQDEGRNQIDDQEATRISSAIVAPAVAQAKFSSSHFSSVDSTRDQGSSWASLHSTNFSGSSMSATTAGGFLLPMNTSKHSKPLDRVASSSSFEDSKSSLLPAQLTNYKPQLAASSIVDNISAPFQSTSMLASSSSLPKIASRQSSEPACNQNVSDHEKSSASRKLSLNDSNQSITSSSAKNSTVYAGGDVSNSRNISNVKKSGQSSSKSNSASVRNSGLSVNARYTVSFHSQSEESPSPLLRNDNEKSSGSVKSRSLFSAVLSSNGTTRSNGVPFSSNSQVATSCGGGSMLNRYSNSPHSEPEEDVFCDGADEDGYDADGHLLSDVSSETLAINSSSPVPRNDVTDEQQHQQQEFGIVTGRSRDSNAYQESNENDRKPSSRSYLEESCASLNSSFTNSCSQNAFTPPDMGGGNRSHAFASLPEKQSASTSDHGFSLEGNSELGSVMSSFTSYTREKDEGLSTKNLEQRDKELQNYIQMLLNNPGTLGLDAFVRNETAANLQQRGPPANEAIAKNFDTTVTSHADHVLPLAPQASKEIANNKTQHQSVTGSTISLASSSNTAERRVTTSSQSIVKTSSKSTTTAKPWK